MKISALGVGLCMIASTALAAPSPGTAPDPDRESADAQARVAADRYVFVEGDTLDGEVLGPTGTHVQRRPGMKHPSLIQLRVAFTDKLVRQTRDM